MASGPIYFFQRPNTTISDAPAADLEAEKQRIAAAQEKSAQQLNTLADKAREETGEETAILFETHAMFVEDKDYVDCMMNALEERHCIAEKAVEIAGEEFTAMLAAMDDPYMQARATDIKDVTRRILNIIEKEHEQAKGQAAGQLTTATGKTWTTRMLEALRPVVPRSCLKNKSCTKREYRIK